MLVFTRKVGEAIMIGDGVEVRVLHVGSDGIRLGIQAAPTIAVHRREIYDRVREENRAAAATGAPGAPQSVAGRLRSITASTIDRTS